MFDKIVSFVFIKITTKFITYVHAFMVPVDQRKNTLMAHDHWEQLQSLGCFKGKLQKGGSRQIWSQVREEYEIWGAGYEKISVKQNQAAGELINSITGISNAEINQGGWLRF